MTGGRPGPRRPLPSYCLAIRCRCQRRMVSGVTRVCRSRRTRRPRRVALAARRWAGRIWTPLSSVRTKPRFNPSYERRWFTFVASWLSAAGASTGQGSAQRSAGGGVALTRAERGGIRRLGFRSPSTLILRGGTASDCRRIFGPSREHARLRATMVNARGDANRWYGPVWPAPVVGVSPRRSDRCAILSRGSPPGEITVQWSPRGYTAMRVSATKGRSSRHTRHTIRASRLAIAAVAMFAPRRAAIARAQVRNGVVFCGLPLWDSTARAPCMSKVRR